MLSLRAAAGRSLSASRVSSLSCASRNLTQNVGFFHVATRRRPCQTHTYWTFGQDARDSFDEKRPRICCVGSSQVFLHYLKRHRYTVATRNSPPPPDANGGKSSLTSANIYTKRKQKGDPLLQLSTGFCLSTRARIAISRI